MKNREKALSIIFRVLISATITLLFGVWAIECAYLERGYQAYGGECLLIIFVFYIAFKISGLKIR